LQNGIKQNTPYYGHHISVVSAYFILIFRFLSVTKFPARFTRRKSLEYEDVDKIKKATSGIRTTLLAASFISKLRSPFSKRTNDNNDPDENWCEQWETTASIRRPRKTVAEQNQHKLLQRAKSEQLSRPGSSHALSASSVYADKRIGASSRYGNKKDEAINVTDLQYEGTVEDGGSLSPRGIPKSRRGGSLKERKIASNEDEAAKMRRCNSTKERRKKNPLSLKDSNGAEIVDENKTLSRKNSKDYKTSKSKWSEGGKSYSLKTSRDSLNKESGSLETINLKEPLSQKSSTEDNKLKTRFKEKHLRQGSLKERGEEKSLKLGGRNRLRGLQSAVSTKKTMKKQMSLSTDSSPLSSPKSSPTSKEKHFDF
jgi:hypothetical protein